MHQSGSAMASQLFASLFSALLITHLLVISVHGRSNLQKKYSSSIKVGAVSHATTYTGKTNYSDVMGLSNIVSAFSWLPLEEANRDPCLPPVWSWIKCNSDPLPRVTALNLRNSNLLGPIPDFSTMDALESIDFQINALTGSIPSFLGDFPRLQKLNLANNYLTGQVPDSLACNTKLKLSLDGNYGLYTSSSCSLGENSTPPTKISTPQPDLDAGDDSYVYKTETYRTKKKSKTPVIVGSSVSIFGVISIAVGIFAIFRHKAKAMAVVAAVDATSAQGTDDEQRKAKPIPMEERPINSRPNNLSP